MLKKLLKSTASILTAACIILTSLMLSPVKANAAGLSITLSAIGYFDEENDNEMRGCVYYTIYDGSNQEETIKVAKTLISASSFEIGDVIPNTSIHRFNATIETPDGVGVGDKLKIEFDIPEGYDVDANRMNNDWQGASDNGIGCYVTTLNDMGNNFEFAIEEEGNNPPPPPQQNGPEIRLEMSAFEKVANPGTYKGTVSYEVKDSSSVTKANGNATWIPQEVQNADDVWKKCDFYLRNPVSEGVNMVAGDTVTFTFTANEGYKFNNNINKINGPQNDIGNVVGNTVTVTISGDNSYHFEASFQEQGVNPPPPSQGELGFEIEIRNWLNEDTNPKGTVGYAIYSGNPRTKVYEKENITLQDLEDPNPPADQDGGAKHYVYVHKKSDYELKQGDLAVVTFTPADADGEVWIDGMLENESYEVNLGEQQGYRVSLEFTVEGNNPNPQGNNQVIMYASTLLMDRGEITDAYNALDNDTKQALKIIPAENSDDWPTIVLNEFNKNAADNELQPLFIDGDVHVLIGGTNKIERLRVGDHGRVEIDAMFIDAIVEEQPQRTLFALNGFEHSNTEFENRSELSFSGNIEILVGDPDPEKFAEVGFAGLHAVNFKNCNWSPKDSGDSRIYALTLFSNVEEVSLNSTKLIAFCDSQPDPDDEVGDMICNDGDAKTRITLSAEAELAINVHGDNLALDKFEVLNRYYASFPANGKADFNDIEWCEYKPGISTYTVSAANITTSFTGNSIKVFNENNFYVFKNTDPILRSVSYEVDDGTSRPNPECGTVTMDGFQRGFYTIDPNNGRFEAWIAEGETVNVTVLPGAGYQYLKGSLNINGESIDNMAPGEKKGSYSFVMPANAGHMCAGFVKTSDVVEENAEYLKSATISNTAGAIDNGNAKLELSDAKVSDNEKKTLQNAAGNDAVIASVLDLEFSEVVVKNYDPQAKEQSSWETPVAELKKSVNVSVALNDKIGAGVEVEVVREHNGKTEIIKSTYDAKSNTLSFDTDKFSTYAIALKATEKKISNVTLKSSNVAYTGKALKPKVTVTDAAGATIASKYYTVTYKNNKEIGKATITVKGKAGYKGSKSISFNIVPAKVKSVSSVKASKKKVLTVKWKKVAKCDGYEIQASTSKDFSKGIKKATAKGATKLTADVKGLKGNTSYYVRVRAYKKVKGKTYYSDWTKFKKVVKTKK